MSTQWNQHGVFAPPGGSGLPAMPQGQQTLPPNQYSGYSIDHLPPAPQQQGGLPYGVQPGVPGAQIAQPLQTAQPQQQWGVPPQASPQGWPAQQPQMPGQFGTPQQPQWPQQQQAQRPGTVSLDDNAILDGPAVPPELRGRTWGDARRLYSALSTDWLQRHGRPTTPAAQSLQAQGFMQPQAPQGPQAPQRPGFQPQGPQTPQAPMAAPADSRQFWANPDQRIAEVVGQVMEQRLGPMLQPMIARNQQGAILEARQVAATGTNDFQYLEPDIMQIVARANPADLQDPQVWISAADMARGRRLASGQYQPQQAQRPQVPGNPNGAGYGPGTSVPAPQGPPVHSFFSESPSAPNVPGAYGSSNGTQATQEDYHFAQKFQMPIQDYMSWKHGAQPAGRF